MPSLPAVARCRHCGYQESSHPIVRSNGTRCEWFEYSTQLSRVELIEMDSDSRSTRPLTPCDLMPEDQCDTHPTCKTCPAFKAPASV